MRSAVPKDAWLKLGASLMRSAPSPHQKGRKRALDLMGSSIDASYFSKKPVYMSHAPQRFVFLLALFCEDERIYKQFAKQISSHWDKRKRTNDLVFKNRIRSELSIANLVRLLYDDK